MLQCPSPNFGPRKHAEGPSYIILHYTAMDTAQAAINRLCDPQYEVSAHYVIDAHGRVTQLVQEQDRAWHAGRSYWRGETDMNSHSIGVELANDGAQPFPMLQMSALVDLLQGIMNRWSIPKQNILGHSDVSLGRKIDPGPRFPWSQLAIMGYAIQPDPKPEKLCETTFLQNAARVGYDVSHPDLVLPAVRLRFRPWEDGPLDEWDCGVMADLAERFIIDVSPITP